ncbi:MAG: hypothetical protein JNM36_03975 [Chitinophagales bacterium]|nr:hypothetical protein [Chitinophagales bacterium]
MQELLTIKEAAAFATAYTNKNITTSNISYLVNYGRIEKITTESGMLLGKQDLINYYNSYMGNREVEWKEQLGTDLNWALSFDYLKEADTTKHIHRLHPYKGKFIPQLVAYFLDTHIDEFKQNVVFNEGDVVLDIFCGSGTTLVQANELGLHAVGIDVSAFNTLISNVKVMKVDLDELYTIVSQITANLKVFVSSSKVPFFENRLLEALNKYNNQFFPSPEFKIKVRKKELNEAEYGDRHEKEFLEIYRQLLAEFQVQIFQENKNRFIEKWYLLPIRSEIDFVFNEIKAINNPAIKKILTVILSRTIRTCRATTHADLATLVEPIDAPYYCAKHGKICKPLFSMVSWWERYTKDTIQRLQDFYKLRTETHQICINGNSESIDLWSALQTKSPALYDIVQQKKIKGIFSSPPYVGLIDYHEQHAYAYDLFGFERKDAEEIGPMFKKQTKKAQQDYVAGISNCLNNCKRFLAEDYDVFLVSNDKYNLYPQIAENAGMQIVNQYKRPVLNRTEKDKGAYAEIIFHLKSKE